MSKETVKQYIRNQYTGKEQCQFLTQMNQQDSLAHSSLKKMELHRWDIMQRRSIRNISE